jgi:hypothetical protein
MTLLILRRNPLIEVPMLDLPFARIRDGYEPTVMAAPAPVPFECANTVRIASKNCELVGRRRGGGCRGIDQGISLGAEAK